MLILLIDSQQGFIIDIGAFLTLIGLVLIIWKALSNKVDEIDQNKADKTTLQKLEADMKQEIREQETRNIQAHKEIVGHNTDLLNQIDSKIDLLVNWIKEKK